MRVRRPTRPPHAGFSLALPPPETSNEVQIQQKNELFINVDDTTVSPVILANGPLFPNVDTNNATGACCFHLNNTNLVVLMNGVAMFTEGKSVHTEDTSAHRAAEKTTLGGTKNSTKKSTASVEDSVEAAIRDIESDSCPPLTSPTVVSAPACTQADPVAMPHVPIGYAALFGAKAKSEGAFSFGPNSLPRTSGRCRGFVPGAFFQTGMNNAAPTTKNTTPTTASGALVLTTPLTKPSIFITGPTKVLSAQDGTSSIFSLTSSMAGESDQRALRPEGNRELNAKGSTKKTRQLISNNDIGLTNRSLDLDAVETLDFIGRGAQGSVHRVMLDGKLYALKCVDVREATETAETVERQGRKRGLVKELNMICLQRTRERPVHLMQMFNAVATLDNRRQQLHILMELMSFSMEDAQCMVSRIPAAELMKLTQSTFRHHLAGSTQVQQQMNELLKQQSMSCMHLLGRKSFNTPEDWETNIDRQTPVPEIILSILAADVLKGLKELHEDYHIVHCDLKPANLLLAFDRLSFKIADFGCGSVMDSETHIVRRLGVDLGSVRYKAPERLSCELVDSSSVIQGEEMPVVQFTAAADVWSLGVMLLELSNGANPCFSFKSDFWNYLNHLKLSRMVKPLSWSMALCDFIVRCLAIDPRERWSVSRLLQHPFILKYSGVPRSKLKSFMERLEVESATFQKRQQREMLERQILLSTGNKAGDIYKKESRTRWKTFTGFLSVAPKFQDEEKFPCLNAR